MSARLPHLTTAERINAERIVLLGWSRAILLQLAHPLVAAAVDEHSTFREHRWSAASRLHLTVRAMLALTFADRTGRERALEGIRSIHRRVHGTLGATAGCFPAGTPYSAEDPALVLWVHATLLESIPLTYDLLVAPLDARQRDAYCAEAASTAVALGAQEEDVPRTWAATRAYQERMYASDAILVTDRARTVAAAVLSPPFSSVPGPAWANKVLTLGLLPPHIREQYGFSWRPRDQRTFERLVPWIRRLRRALPDRLALWPQSR